MEDILMREASSARPESQHQRRRRRPSSSSAAAALSQKRSSYSDRFIPMRSGGSSGVDLHAAFDLLPTSPLADSQTGSTHPSSAAQLPTGAVNPAQATPVLPANAQGATPATGPAQTAAANPRATGATDGERCRLEEDHSLQTYSLLLKSELFGGSATRVDSAAIAASHTSSTGAQSFQSSGHGHSASFGQSDPFNTSIASDLSTSLLEGFSATTPSPPPTHHASAVASMASSVSTATEDYIQTTPLPYKPANVFRFQDDEQLHSRGSPFSLSPVGQESAKVLKDLGREGGRRISRKIAKAPFKVLDAPSLQDDFYLNLMDWSSQNVIAIGLGSNVYLWSACNSSVTKLVDLGLEGTVCSVSWSLDGETLAVGASSGRVFLFDAATHAQKRVFGGHNARVGCLAWNSTCLSSGSRDRSIYNRDPREARDYMSELKGHRQEVCGLKWSHNESQLASGGNDNKLFVWSPTSTQAMMRFSEHEAAVKAIAWSPHQRGLLASGGGTADRTIRFWNTTSQTPLQVVDTGSQVCNLAWSKNVNEVVSTHGYSQNQIIVWRYPSLSKLVTLTGHSYRVLFLAMSPSGENIATGAGDETLRFWNVFPGPRNTDTAADYRSPLSKRTMNIR